LSSEVASFDSRRFDESNTTLALKCFQRAW
jgi:hypothetical protein